MRRYLVLDEADQMLEIGFKPTEQALILHELLVYEALSY